MRKLLSVRLYFNTAAITDNAIHNQRIVRRSWKKGLAKNALAFVVKLDDMFLSFWAFEFISFWVVVWGGEYLSWCLSLWVGEFMSLWVVVWVYELVSLWVCELMFEFLSFWAGKFLSLWGGEFMSWWVVVWVGELVSLWFIEFLSLQTFYLNFLRYFKLQSWGLKNSKTQELTNL